VPDFKGMRRLPASSVFRGPQLGKQGLRTEFRYQGIISYRVVEAFEPLIIGSHQLRFVLLGEDFLQTSNGGRLGG
jgi:hypothetical protein